MTRNGGTGSSGPVPVSDTVTGLSTMCAESGKRRPAWFPRQYGRAMARELRNEEVGAFYHMTSRGNDGQALYLDARDHTAFLTMFSLIVRELGWVVYAYCLMPNHFHVLVLNARGGLSAGMQRLNGGYSRRTNRRYGRSGHLFRNRFFAARLETYTHLLEALRYIALNPVRGGLCERPEAWAWSSYGACAGFARPAEFLARDKVLALFAPQPLRAMDRYRTFVSAGLVTSGHDPVSDTVTGL